MIIPIGQEDESVRRIPWVTFTIMGICLIFHIFVSSQMNSLEKRAKQLNKDFSQYFMTHPYLELDPELEKYMFEDDHQKELFQETLKSLTGKVPQDEDQVAEEQEELNRLMGEIKNIMTNNAYMKYGLIPAKKKFFNFLSYMFIHVGWLHLIFNLLFLYITGPYIEDAWGRPLFLVFYLVMGILSAQLFSIQYPTSTGPLIGASGAIAGVMGAFLIRFFKTKIRFFYIFSVLVRGTFSAPAWLMLPLWLLLEIMNAQYMDKIDPTGASGGVAHWAHIWGFIFGVAVAMIIKILKFEEKFVAPIIEAQTSYVDESYKSSKVLDEALALREIGKGDKAYAMVLEEVKRNPANTELVEGLWNISQDTGKQKETAFYYIRMIEREVRQNQVEIALHHYKTIKRLLPDVEVNFHSKIEFMEHMVREGDFRDAGDLYTELVKDISLNSPPGLLVQFCSVAIILDDALNTSNAPGALELVLKHPDIPENRKNELKRQIAEIPDKDETAYPTIDEPFSVDMVGIPGAGTAANNDAPIKIKETSNVEKSVVVDDPVRFGEPMNFEQPVKTDNPVKAEIPTERAGDKESPAMPGVVELDLGFEKTELPPPPPPPPPPPVKNIFVTRAAPTDFKEKKIHMNVENVGPKILSMEHILAVAAVKISPQGERPFLLIDLFLDDPTSEITDVRTIRLSSKTFNPRQFIASAPNLLEAYQVFISIIINMSGAKSVPDHDSAHMINIMNFPSITEYEEFILSGKGVEG